MAGTAAIALIAGASAVGSQIDTDFGFVTQAKAQQGQGKMQGGKGGQSGQGGQGAGQGGQGGGKGGPGGVPKASTSDDGDDSDRPEWAGAKGGKAGGGQGGRPETDRGDLYGDLWIILRDDQGLPIFTEITTPEGDKIFVVQPIDADGNPIPLDEEGKPLDETLTQEADLGRLNMGRAPSKVLDQRLSEVIKNLESATALSLDPAGRLILTIDGEEKTIDSPLENLALYIALITVGGVDANLTFTPTADFSALFDGTVTAADVDFAASFLATANDKTSPMVIDEVAYINNILGLGTLTDLEGKTYVDFATVMTDTYSRESVYGDVTANVLILDPNTGTWVPTTINVFETVFNSETYTGSGDIEAFTQAAEDARLVIDYIHEYEVPAN
jgi:hypothetical protein